MNSFKSRSPSKISKEVLLTWINNHFSNQLVANFCFRKIAIMEELIEGEDLESDRELNSDSVSDSNSVQDPDINLDLGPIPETIVNDPIQLWSSFIEKIKNIDMLRAKINELNCNKNYSDKNCSDKNYSDCSYEETEEFFRLKIKIPSYNAINTFGLSTLENNPRLFAKALGSKSSCMNRLDRLLKNIYDNSVISNIGSALHDIIYPIGIPTIIDMDNKNITLREALEELKFELVDGMFTFLIRNGDSPVIPLFEDNIYRKFSIVTSEEIKFLNLFKSNPNYDSALDSKVVTFVGYQKSNQHLKLHEWSNSIISSPLIDPFSFSGKPKDWYGLKLSPLIDQFAMILSSNYSCSFLDNHSMPNPLDDDVCSMKADVRFTLINLYVILTSVHFPMSNLVVASNVFSRLKNKIYI